MALITKGLPVIFNPGGASVVSGDPSLITDGNLDSYHEVAVPWNSSISPSWLIELQKAEYIPRIQWKYYRYQTNCSINASIEYRRPDGSWAVAGSASGAYGVINTEIIQVGALATAIRISASSARCTGATGIRIYELEAHASGMAFSEPGSQWWIDSKDFGSVVAGNPLGPTAIDLHNGTSQSVQIPQLYPVNVPPGEEIELSKTATPFIPEDPLVFSGTFAPDALIGTVYVRIRPPITSSGTKTFKLRATARPA